MKRIILVIIATLVSICIYAQDTLVYVNVAPRRYIDITRYNLVLITKDANGEITIPTSYADKCTVIENKGIVMEVNNDTEGRVLISLIPRFISNIKEWKEDDFFLISLKKAVETYELDVNELKNKKIVTFVFKRTSPMYIETNDIKFESKN